MLHVGKPLITSHYTDAEFSGVSVLNAGITIDAVNDIVLKPTRKNGVRRKKSQTNARRSTKF